MTTVRVDSFETWRAAARQLLAEHVAPDVVLWTDGQSSSPTLPLESAPRLQAQPQLPSAASASAARSRPSQHPGSSAFRVPRRFISLASDVALHRDADKWALLYRVLWRLSEEGSTLLDDAADADVHRLGQLAAAVRRDDHKMRAFVRFTPVDEDGITRSVAFYRPDHHIVKRVAPFFADRFATMHWSILTPELSVHWDGQQLEYSAGIDAAPPSAIADSSDSADADGTASIETLWRTYYASMFNPARANLKATLREMPLRRWAGLPEAEAIPQLLATAHEKTIALPSGQDDGARPFVPSTSELTVMHDAATLCRGCALHARATQVVFGEGPRDARLMLVGEQPGDAEDRRGQPFVGPAGDVLDRALAAAGIERETVYVTNAVKHFSFEERGKRRIHKTPRASDVRACRPWLEAEIQALRPHCIVCLGATAATSLLGPQARVNALRGRPITNTAWAGTVFVTVHPSAVLRADDSEAYFDMLVSDLQQARLVVGP